MTAKTAEATRHFQEDSHWDIPRGHFKARGCSAQPGLVGADGKRWGITSCKVEKLNKIQPRRLNKGHRSTHGSKVCALLHVSKIKSCFIVCRTISFPFFPPGHFNALPTEGSFLGIAISISISREACVHTTHKYCGRTATRRGWLMEEKKILLVGQLGNVSWHFSWENYTEPIS